VTENPVGKRDAGRDGATPLDEVLAGLDSEERGLVRSWLAGSPDAETVRPLTLLGQHEPVGVHATAPPVDDPRAVRSVGVIGGGTAGYLTALALRARRPWLRVSLVESSTIPIIGVGEATVNEMVAFLHQFLGIDPVEFYREVRPTWKLGIKFDWGPDPEGFLAPFDWASHSVGMLGALEETGRIDGFSVQSLLMAAGKTPILMAGDRPVSLLKYLPTAYHLDNARLVAFLTAQAERRGVEHVDATVADVVLRDREWIDHLRTTDGRTLSYDLYVDCTGFRSRLLGDALGEPFESFADSLFTDSAVTGNRDHGGYLKPYTTATTMDAGWCWTIPTPEEDHHGYVFSSAAISDEEAAAELRQRFPGVSEPKFVRFRSGRRTRAWRGNVMAVGNSYGFVEPLQSSGLAMVNLSIRALLAGLPATWSGSDARAAVNLYLGAKWDELRWFLAIHYKFNTRLDTPFWKQARAETDVSGLQPLLDVYATGAPVARQGNLIRRMLKDVAPPFYGLAGIDNVLLGQQVPTVPLPRTEPIEQWRLRSRAARALVDRALPQREALEAVARDPSLITSVHEDADSWLNSAAALALNS
jgi:tryptophan halogenase